MTLTRLAPLLLTLVTPAMAASMPQEFVGKWAGGDHCGFTIDSTGYSGTAESGRYRCTLKTISQVPNTEHFRATFLCEGEFGKVRMSSTMTVQSVGNDTILAMLDTADKRDAHKIASPQSFTICRKGG